MKSTPKPPKSLSILFADDEESLQEVMRLELPRMGHRVTVCPDGLTAVAALEKDSFDCLLVDLDMPGLNGIGVIQRAKEICPTIEAVVLTGKQSVESAIQAMRFGACDYVTKPCRLADLETLLTRMAQRRDLSMKYQAAQRQLEHKQGKMQLIGNHPSMEKVRKLVEKVAPATSTVLIRGETGCGKELVARAVHDCSPRRDQPFVAVNCGALPENLIESELFGHRKGSFTGADTHREGLFEVADGGTIFLDEIGELPLSLQAKLLRVLESGEIRRVGDSTPFKVDVRVVCATHRDLEEMVEEGTFREDLLFRINAFEINVPPLRERLTDLPELATHLFYRCRPEFSNVKEPFTHEAMDELCSHVWPGNVRELANVIEHATIICDALPIDSSHLPRHFTERRLRKTIKMQQPMSLRDLELQAIQEAMQRHQGNKPAVAEELGISLKTLYNKLGQMEPQQKAA